MTGRVAASPLARGSRGNLTHVVESSLKPDRCHFERNSGARGTTVLLRRLAALAARLPSSKN